MNTIIVAHPERRTMAQHLADTIDAHIQWDTHSRGATWNHRQAWKHLADTDRSQWSIVLEDDAIPTPNYRHIGQWLDTAPSPVVSLYLGYGAAGASQQAAVQHAVNEHPHAQWYTAPRTIGAVGLAIHTSLIPDLLTTTRHMGAAWDDAVGAWAQQKHHMVSFTNPSLIDHADLPSLIHVRRPPRKAHRVSGEFTPGVVIPLW